MNSIVPVKLHPHFLTCWTSRRGMESRTPGSALCGSCLFLPIDLKSTAAAGAGLPRPDGLLRYACCWPDPQLRGQHEDTVKGPGAHL